MSQEKDEKKLKDYVELPNETNKPDLKVSLDKDLIQMRQTSLYYKSLI